MIRLLSRCSLIAEAPMLGAGDRAVEEIPTLVGMYTATDYPLPMYQNRNL
jgi:hypothetical protein